MSTKQETDYLVSQGKISPELACTILNAQWKLENASTYLTRTEIYTLQLMVYSWPFNDYFTRFAHLLFSTRGNPLDDNENISVLRCQAEELIGTSAHPGIDMYWASEDKSKNAYPLDDWINIARLAGATLSRIGDFAVCKACSSNEPTKYQSTVDIKQYVSKFFSK